MQLTVVEFPRELLLLYLVQFCTCVYHKLSNIDTYLLVLNLQSKVRLGKTLTIFLCMFPNCSHQLLLMAIPSHQS